ncbi:hypothetical protein HH213_17870 [Duganella dendranthematis]|uniref:Uncharacterized protein n=1 Tax=Duganella dendranthematis TaxID=2728021 RepID=A0ABX6MC47_9BURK|nr:hypothetical protein [Duganella dendranthematis]QJD91790.1 hypothetical protein HH213_17870 [Duganella dendranthematis]
MDKTEFEALRKRVVSQVKLAPRYETMLLNVLGNLVGRMQADAGVDDRYISADWGKYENGGLDFILAFKFDDMELQTDLLPLRVEVGIRMQLLPQDKILRFSFKNEVRTVDLRSDETEISQPLQPVIDIVDEIVKREVHAFFV